MSFYLLAREILNNYHHYYRRERSMSFSTAEIPLQRCKCDNRKLMTEELRKNDEERVRKTREEIERWKLHELRLKYDDDYRCRYRWGMEKKNDPLDNFIGM